MEDRNARLFCITFMPNLLVLLMTSTGVISMSIQTPTIVDVMKNDTRLCNASKILYDSEYIKPCVSLPYSSSPWTYTPETLNQFLCLGVYDTAYKICQYSSRLQISLDNASVLDSYIKKFVPTHNNSKYEQEEKFCKDNLQEFKSLYNKTDPLWRPLIENLNKPHKCVRICFDYNDKFRPFCALLAWIKSVDDIIMKLNKPGMVHDIDTSDKVTNINNVNELKSKTVDDKTTKSIAAEMKSQADAKGKQKKQETMSEIHLKDKNKGSHLNVSTNIPNEHTFLEAQAHDQVSHEENTKDVANSGPQASSVNNAAGNVPNTKVENEVVEESDKKQDDIKTSTLSDNTQDVADNLDEDVEPNVGDTDDTDDTFQQPIENRNENQQETSEQKSNLQYPNIRTEDDSHFFTYFTVITVACIAGYIGYHNKQKILAIVLEGRRSRSNRGRRRPSTASYRKLDCTLEEAVTSQCNANVTHVIY